MSLKRSIKTGLIMVLLFTFGHAAFILLDGFNDEAASHALAVVPGNTVTPDGMPSIRLQERLDRAVEAWNSGEVSRIIVSGARGGEGPNEAIVMAAYLEGQGIGPEWIVIDTAGVDTRATCRFTAAVADALHPAEIFVISHWYHISRTKMCLRQYGLQNVKGAYARQKFRFRDLWSLLREIPAFYFYLLSGPQD